MKKLYLLAIIVLSVLTFTVQAGQCEDLAQQAANASSSANNVSDLVRVKQINQTMQSLGCGGGHSLNPYSHRLNMCRLSGSGVRW